MQPRQAACQEPAFSDQRTAGDPLCSALARRKLHLRTASTLCHPTIAEPSLPPPGPVCSAPDSLGVSSPARWAPACSSAAQVNTPQVALVLCRISIKGGLCDPNHVWTCLRSWAAFQTVSSGDVSEQPSLRKARAHCRNFADGTVASTAARNSDSVVATPSSSRARSPSTTDCFSASELDVAPPIQVASMEELETGTSCDQSTNALLLLQPHHGNTYGRWVTAKGDLLRRPARHPFASLCNSVPTRAQQRLR